MAKRAIGEGSVRQRPNGLWEARLSYIDPQSGRRRSVSLYAATAEEVRDKLDEARDRIKTDVPVRDSSQQLAEWITHWSATALEASPRKESTKTLYRNLARKHLSPAPFGATPLDKLRKTHVDGLVVALRKRSLSDSTVRQVYTVLRAILDDAKIDGLIADNPAAKMARPRVARTEARHLSASEVTAVLGAAEGLRYRPVLALIAATGLRRGEALALRWEHLNLADGTLKVAATLSRVGEQLVITEPKSARSRRTVPLSPGIVALLKAQRATQVAEHLHAGSRWTDSGLVFTTEFGTPVEPRNILRTIENAAAKAGIEDVGVHTLRHSAAVAWLEAGVHIKAVADLLGHSSIAITGDIYGHTSDATTRAAIDGLTSTLGI
jgi:integrase